MRKNRILKVKNGLLELKTILRQLTYIYRWRKWTNKRIWRKRNNKEEKVCKNIWYDCIWLAIFLSPQKTVGGVKDEIISVFKTNKTKDYSKPKCGKKPPKETENASEDNIIKNIMNLFILRKENEAIQERKINDINTLFEQQKEGYYKPVRIDRLYRNSYIEYVNNGVKNKTLSIKKYLAILERNHK